MAQIVVKRTGPGEAHDARISAGAKAAGKGRDAQFFLSVSYDVTQKTKIEMSLTRQEARHICQKFLEPLLADDRD